MSKRTLILQGIVVAIDALTLAFFVNSARLFTDAYLSLNRVSETTYCPLYLKFDDSSNNSSNNDPCVIAIISEVFAATCLVLLMLASILKYVRQDYK